MLCIQFNMHPYVRQCYMYVQEYMYIYTHTQEHVANRVGWCLQGRKKWGWEMKEKNLKLQQTQLLKGMMN